jgi:outer membrane cobalamin receptor
MIASRQPSEPSSRRGRFTTREIALLGLMAALWGVTEVTLGGLIKGWRVPFSGAVLATLGVVILLTARSSVPVRWSSLLIGITAAGLRMASGFGGAVFAAIGIVVEALIIEVVLSLAPRGWRSGRFVAGVLALWWALVHPFVVQGYLMGKGPATVYKFTVELIAGPEKIGSGHALAVLGFLIVIHTALGVSAVMFVDKILLAPLARALRHTTSSIDGENGRRDGRGGRGRRGPAITPAVVLAAVLVLSAAPAARADENDSSRDGSQGGSRSGPVYYLSELTVIATRLVGPYSVVHVDAEKISESGAGDLAEVLEMVPGFVVTMNSRGEAKLNTRGLGERELVVLVDGVPISDPYSGSVNAGMILAGALGAVRVTRGPAASVYGANALGGIVEVSTVGGGRSGLSYKLATGTDGRYSGFVAGGGLVGRVHLSGGIAADGASDFSLPASFESTSLEDGGLRDYSGAEQLMAWSRASWRLSETARASVAFNIADGRRDAPVSTDSDRPRYWGFPFWRETRTVATVNWQPMPAAHIEGRMFYSTNDNQLAAYSDFDRENRRWLSSVSNHALGGYVCVDYKGFEGHGLWSGLNVREDVARLQRDIGDEWIRYEATTASLFGQDVIALGEKDRVSLAVNGDMMVGEDRSLASINPQAAWTHMFPSDISVRLLGGLKTRFPTLKEWFSTEIGNPDLRPEQSVSFETELARRTSTGSRLSLLLFDQHVTDMISTTGSGDPARNIGRVHSWGAEFSVEHPVMPELNVGLSLAMTSARDVEAGEDVPLVPKTMAVVTTTYERGPASIFARIARVGPRSSGNGGSLPAHVLIDARTTVETRWGDVFVGAENLFDVLYEDEEGFPQPGRGFEIGIMRDLSH